MECTDFQNAIADGIREYWECVPLSTSTLHVVTTSLLPNDDCIELVIEDQGDSVRINDMALSYTFLTSYGITLYTARYKKYLRYVEQVAGRYHADFVNGELSKEVARNDLWTGVQTLVEAIQLTCGLVNRMRATRPYNFKEQVYALFAARRSRATMDFPVTGFAQTHTFDVRLNSTGEVLARAISSTQASAIQKHIERAIYAFEDVRRTERPFEPMIVYDDSEADRDAAWSADHFSILQRYDVDAYAFQRHRDTLTEIAQDHQM